MGYWKKPSSYGIDDAQADTRARAIPVQRPGSYGITDALADTRGRARTNAQMRPRPGIAGTVGAAKTKPLSIAERARLRIAAIYDPVLKQISDDINRQAKTQQDSIFGYSTQLAGEMGKYVGSFGDIYAKAQQSQASADAASAQRLEGGGNKLAGELAAKLGAINAPGSVTSGISGAAAATGAGSANAAYARGSADLTRLIAQGATEQTYAAKQPGFVLSRGQQDITNVARQAAQDIESETSALRAKIPGDTADLIDQMTATAEEKQAAKQKARQERFDREWEAATLKVAYGQKLTPREKAILKMGYGANPDAVKIQGQIAVDKAEQAWRSAEQRAKDAARAAREAAADARRAQREASRDARTSAREKARDARTAARQAADDARAAKAALAKARASGKTKKPSGAPSAGDIAG